MRNIVIIVGVCILLGCSTHINNEVAFYQITDDSGIDKNRVQAFMRATFTVTSKNSDKGVWMPCFIVLYDSELLLYSADKATKKIVKNLRIPYSNLHGVDVVKKNKQIQVHILGKIGILALEIMSPNSDTIDQGLSTKLANTLKGENVPLFKSRGIIYKSFFPNLPFVMPIPNSFIF